MASTVEQCDSKSLGPLSTTLEMFDTFKSSQDEDKDSDEESFHLPLLGCDDETENDKETSPTNCESEDDILNKFETSATPDIDPKLEETILNGEDENITITENNTKDSDSDSDSHVQNKEMGNKVISRRDSLEGILPGLEVIDEINDSKDSNTDNETEATETMEIVEEKHAEIQNDQNNSATTKSESSGPFKIDSVAAEKEKHNTLECGKIVQKNNQEKQDCKKISYEDEPNENQQTADIAFKAIETATEDSNQDEKPVDTKINDEPSEKTIENRLDTENKKKSSKQLTLDKAENLANLNKKKEGLEDENKKTIEEEAVHSSKSSSEEIVEDKIEEEAVAMEVDTLEKNDSNNLEEKIDSSDKSKETGEPQTEGDDKDLECEDLLDISVIRDVDEDNASAIAAEITETETHSSEKSDIDEQEDKEETEVDDMETDTQISTEKDEAMEFDDNTNSCDQDTSTTDNIVSENTSDGENKENEPLQSDTENQQTTEDVTDADSNKMSAEVDSVQENNENTNKSLDKESAVPVENLTESDPQNVPSKPTEEPTEKQNKRPFYETEDPQITKKMRLTEIVDKPKKPDSKKKSVATKNDKVKTLVNFEQYMKRRNLGDGKLTRSDLEQFCLQKICEAIIHKTEVGELHQTIKKQENIIDSLRKDLQQLAKQTRDLDIVNKKLMNELKTQNGNQKPLVPLKITRSVGLQVKLNVGIEPVSRRKSYTSNTPRTPNTPNNNTANRNRSIPQGNVVRQIAPPTPPVNAQRKPVAPPPVSAPAPAPAPILTQALQSRVTPPTTPSPAAVNKRPVIRNKNPEPAKPSAPGVIDLTDEDDRTAKTLAQKNVTNNVAQKNMGNKSINTPVKIIGKNINIVQNKSPANKGTNVSPKTGLNKVGMQARATAGLPQGVRLTAAQMKNGLTLPAGVVTTNAQGTTQLMYVVQPGSLVNTTAGGGQKAVLLNFQPTNGVLTSTLNGSTVSVIPSKTTNTMQLKPVVVARKHPAPLPLPPPAIINSTLKKLLPKPHLSIRKTDTGIILQWRMPYNLDDYEGIASYQLFAYQETNAPPSTDMWRKVGDVKALALPMACTLTQFADKNKYYFAVRSVDVHKRIGAFSDPEEISL